MDGVGSRENRIGRVEMSRVSRTDAMRSAPMTRNTSSLDTAKVPWHRFQLITNLSTFHLLSHILAQQYFQSFTNCIIHRQLPVKMAQFVFVSALLLATAAQGFISPAPVPAVNSWTAAVRQSRQPLHLTLNDFSATQKDIPKSTEESLAENTVNELATLTEQTETETQKLMRQVKDAGVAGVISYALWELAFWFVSVPVVLFGYYEVTGHMPDLSNSDDMAKLGAEAFAFVNFARFAVPLRIGLALSTTSWIQTNIVDRFMKNEQVASSANNDPDVVE
jgi:hypothetical protein